MDNRSVAECLGGVELAADSLVFLGNPGCGKSTIINGIGGRPHSPSGESEDGLGLTKDVIHVLKNHKTYYDTPGILDANSGRRTDNVGLINEVLRSDQSMAICFVARIKKVNERWDVSWADAVAMKLVLNCFNISDEDKKDKIGIIFNQVSLVNGQSPIEKKTAQKLVLKLTGAQWETKHWCFVPWRETLQGKKNMHLICKELLKLYNSLPVAKPSGARVRTITIKQDIIDRLKDEFHRCNI